MTSLDQAANVILIVAALCIPGGIGVAIWLGERARLGQARIDEAVRLTLGRGA